MLATRHENVHCAHMFVSGCLGILLAACGTNPEHRQYWVKPGASPEDSRAAHVRCMDTAADPSIPYPYTGDFFYQRTVDVADYQLCMKQSGYLQMVGSVPSHGNMGSRPSKTPRNIFAERLGLTADMLLPSSKTAFPHPYTAPSPFPSRSHHRVSRLERTSEGTRITTNETSDPTRAWFLYKRPDVSFDTSSNLPLNIGIVDLRVVQQRARPAQAHRNRLAELEAARISQLGAIHNNIQRAKERLHDLPEDSPQIVATRHDMEQDMDRYIQKERDITRDIQQQRKEFGASLLKDVAAIAQQIAERRNLDLVLKTFGDTHDPFAALPPSLTTAPHPQPHDLTSEIIQALNVR